MSNFTFTIEYSTYEIMIIGFIEITARRKWLFFSHDDNIFGTKEAERTSATGYCRIDWLIFSRMKARAKLRDLIYEALSVGIIVHKLAGRLHYSQSSDAVSRVTT